MPNLTDPKLTKELNDEELEKVSGGTADISNARFQKQDIIMRIDCGWEEYYKIEKVFISDDELMYTYRFFNRNSSDTRTIKGSGVNSESGLASFNLCTAVPSYVNFD